MVTGSASVSAGRISPIMRKVDTLSKWAGTHNPVELFYASTRQCGAHEKYKKLPEITQKMPECLA
jgi:hypothetical protein